MGDMDGGDLGALNTDGYLENVYRVQQADADAGRQQSGDEQFEETLHEKEKEEDHAEEGEDARPREPIHDDIHLSDQARSILCREDEDMPREASPDGEEEQEPPGTPGEDDTPPGGHIDLIA
jgi:hypothetical protein